MVGIVLPHALMEPASESCLGIIIVMPTYTIDIEPSSVLHYKLKSCICFLEMLCQVGMQREGNYPCSLTKTQTASE